MRLPDMRVRVAMRYTVRNRQESPESLRKPHYVRLHIMVELPDRDVYLQKLISTAAKASDSLPFIRRTKPVEVVLDLPVSLDRRRNVQKALQSLPFVRSVVVGSGPPIR